MDTVVLTSVLFRSSTGTELITALETALPSESAVILAEDEGLRVNVTKTEKDAGAYGGAAGGGDGDGGGVEGEGGG